MMGWLLWLFLGQQLRVEGEASSNRSEGEASAEAHYRCGDTLQTTCEARGLGRADIDYQGTWCHEDDGVWSCLTACTGKCGTAQ